MEAGFWGAEVKEGLAKNNHSKKEKDTNGALQASVTAPGLVERASGCGGAVSRGSA